MGTIKVTDGKTVKVVERETESITSSNSQPELSVEPKEIDLNVDSDSGVVGIVERDIEVIRVADTQGLQGIQGIPGEQGPKGDEEVYSERIDFITDDFLYKGWADPGTLTSEPLWRILQVEIAADSDVAKKFADGDNNFDNVWDNRLSLTYN